MQIETNKHLLAGLTAFGLTKKESLIYIIGLYLGSSTVIELARHAKLPRTTAYSILEPLVREGIFHVGKRKKQTVYTAQAPSVLEQLFQKKTVFLSRNYRRIKYSISAQLSKNPYNHL